MEVTRKQVRNYRLQAHHLDKRIPMENLLEVVGACGMQNSPPGAWEAAIYNRLKDVSLENLDNALYLDKTLLQAWSFRGVPVIFPTEQSDIFCLRRSQKKTNSLGSTHVESAQHWIIWIYLLKNC